MNGVYFYFVNKLFLVGRYWDFKLNYKNIFTVLKFTEHYLEKLNENYKMEQLPINVCFETLLFPSNPICSNFQFSIDSSSGFAFSVLSAL